MEDYFSSSDSESDNDNQVNASSRIEQLQVTGNTDVKIGHTIHFNINCMEKNDALHLVKELTNIDLKDSSIVINSALTEAESAMEKNSEIIPNDNIVVGTKGQIGMEETLNIQLDDGTNLHNIMVEEHHNFKENVVADGAIVSNCVDDKKLTLKIPETKNGEKSPVQNNVENAASTILTPDYFKTESKFQEEENPFFPNHSNSSTNCYFAQEICSRRVGIASNENTHEKSLSDSVEVDCSQVMQRPLQRLQTQEQVSEWQLLEKDYIESHNFWLGIKDCQHFQSSNGVVVEVPNGKNFEIVIGKSKSVRCNVDITVNGNLVAPLQLRRNETEYTLRGPVPFPDEPQRKFVFFRARDAPNEAGIDLQCHDNGVVEAKFMPERISISQNSSTLVKRRGLASNFDNFQSMFSTSMETAQNAEYRSVSGVSWVAGAVALQGVTEKTNYIMAEDIKTDPDGIVILKLRMVARKDDPSIHNTNEEIVPLYEARKPPPVPI